ncbi:hypothetical protein [Dietzia lutea]|uniref:Uncharacterized protein n=1 Tax=Dietzia lutea TaxID=546160 RepID=A0A2S1R5Y5_9ACTN|nr:hypothetical protein [Dietzia lutea]AWH91672.1 hypothetical protein A6035_05315 [Dietzia lutea]
MSDTLSSRATGGGSRATGAEAASADPAPVTVKHRPAWIAFVILGAIVCVGMGLWQLARYQEASGTVQNLGYTFMWPFLGGFLIYAYLKYVRMEAAEDDWASVAEGAAGARGADDDDDDEPDHRAKDLPTGGKNGSGRDRFGVLTEIPADLLPTRRPAADEGARDEGLDAYNAYLAELARKDRAAGGNHQERSAS